MGSRLIPARLLVLAVLVSVFAVVEATAGRSTPVFGVTCFDCFDDDFNCPLATAKFEVGDRVSKARYPEVSNARVRAVVEVGGEFYYDLGTTAAEWFVPEALLTHE